MSYLVSQTFSPPANVDLCSRVVGGVMSDPCFVVDVSQTFLEIIGNRRLGLEEKIGGIRFE